LNDRESTFKATRMIWISIKWIVRLRVLVTPLTISAKLLYTGPGYYWDGQLFVAGKWYRYATSYSRQLSMVVPSWVAKTRTLYSSTRRTVLQLLLMSAEGYGNGDQRRRMACGLGPTCFVPYRGCITVVFYDTGCMHPMLYLAIHYLHALPDRWISGAASRHTTHRPRDLHRKVYLMNTPFISNWLHVAHIGVDRVSIKCAISKLYVINAEPKTLKWRTITSTHVSHFDDCII